MSRELGHVRLVKLLEERQSGSFLSKVRQSCIEYEEYGVLEEYKKLIKHNKCLKLK